MAVRIPSIIPTPFLLEDFFSSYDIFSNPTNFKFASICLESYSSITDIGWFTTIVISAPGFKLLKIPIKLPELSFSVGQCFIEA